MATFRIMYATSILLVCILAVRFLTGSLQPDEEWFAESGPQKVTLVELYTSQGCSSCPPAETFLSNAVKHYQLWTQIIPIEFHVNYWDYIGWKDKYGSEEFAKRQRAHFRLNNVSSVYTPSFVIDGKEWQGFFNTGKIPFSTNKGAPILKIKLLNDNQIFVKAENISKDNININVAILANDIMDNITSGENANRTLEHNFVLIALEKNKRKNTGFWTLPIPKYDKTIGSNHSLVVWLSDERMQIIQATGNHLNRF